MILATPSGDRLARAFAGSDFIPPPGSEAAAAVGGGRHARDLAVASVGNAVRLVSETIASFVMRIYEGHGSERRPVMSAHHAQLFQDPAEGDSSFDLWADTVTSLELDRHAFLWKVRGDRRVMELIPVDPANFRVRRARATEPKVIEARVNGRIEDVTTRVIHIRGWAAVPGVEGVSTLQQHRRAFSAASAYDDYRGRYFENDAAPGIIIEHPGRPDRTQRRELLAAWARRHGGPQNAGRPGIIWGGVKVSRFTPTMRDTQAAEMSDAIARDVARAFRIFPPELIHATAGGKMPATAELVSDLFLRFSLLGRMRRIERALAADRDLFRDWRRYPRFDTSEFLRADYRTMAGVFHDLVQVGILTPDEGRAGLGYAPLPDGIGQKVNWPPVGGTSPAKGGGGEQPADDDDEDEEPPAAPSDDDQEDES